MRHPVTDERAESSGSEPSPDALSAALGARLARWPRPALLASDEGVLMALNDEARGLLALKGQAPEGRLLAGVLGVEETRELLTGSRTAVLPAREGRPAIRAFARPTREGGFLLTLGPESDAIAAAGDLEQAARLASIGELLSSVAHELNNPLTSVLGYAELLLAEERDSLPREELECIRDEAARCKRIVANLLDLARSERLELAPVHVGDVVGKVLDFRRYAAGVRGVELLTDVAPDLPFVQADFHRLVQAVLNLVTNAEHAVADRAAGARVTVRARRNGAEVAIEVEDNGPGVPAEDATAIFEPFFTTKPRGRGTGLGLSLVRTTAQSHGGAVRVERAASGGARFVIELPAAE